MSALDHPLLPELSSAYADVRGVRRDVRMQDRLEEDLDIDSLSAMELLVALEERLGVRLVDDPRVTGLKTAGDLIELLDEPTRDGQAGVA